MTADRSEGMAERSCAGWIPRAPAWRRRRRLDLALLLGSFAAACVPAPPEPLPDAPLAGPFHIEDDGDGRPPRLVDAAFGTVLLRGVNLSQTAKSPPYVPLEVDTPEGRAALAAEGPLAVRLLTSWTAIEPDEGVFDEAALARLQETTRALADDGHLILLDLHQDLYGPAFLGNGAPPWSCTADISTFSYREPWFQNYEAPEVKACFDELFGDDDRLVRMAQALRRVVAAAVQGAGGSLVGVDLINEPHPGTRSPVDFDARLARYYELASEALIADPVTADVALFFEPNVKHNLGEPTHLQTAPSPRSVWAPHLYPLDVEIGQYNDFIGLDALVRGFADDALAFGVPLVVGEYGPVPRDARAADYVDDVLYLLDQQRAGAFVWDWSAVSDRGLLRDDVSDETRAMVLRPTARRVPGRLLAHAFVDDVLTVSFEVTPDAHGAVEITVPQRYLVDEIDTGDDVDAVIVRDDPRLVRVRPTRRGSHELVVRFSTTVPP
jgi:endoglycosylceramidase